MNLKKISSLSVTVILSFALISCSGASNQKPISEEPLGSPIVAVEAEDKTPEKYFKEYVKKNEIDLRELDAETALDGYLKVRNSSESNRTQKIFYGLYMISYLSFSSSQTDPSGKSLSVPEMVSRSLDAQQILDDHGLSFERWVKWYEAQMKDYEEDGFGSPSTT